MRRRKWNKALLDNAARPSGALVHDSGDGAALLAAEQFERLRAELEAHFSGAANAGRPLLLEGGLKWQAMSLTPADMDFVGLKAAAAREIALAFGVPPMLLGLPGDATYANYREANRALWRLTVLPMADADPGRDRGGARRAGGRGSGSRSTSTRSARSPRTASGCGRRSARADFLSDGGEDGRCWASPTRPPMIIRRPGQLRTCP